MPRSELIFNFFSLFDIPGSSWSAFPFLRLRTLGPFRILRFTDTLMKKPADLLQGVAGVDLSSFLNEQEIDVFSAVGIDNLPEEDRESIKDFFPDARSVIVFGKEVSVEVYRMPAREKTRGMLRIAESLDRSAKRLAKRLNDENIPARPVPLYLPVRIEEGRVQGLVRLKHVAAAGGLGSTGMNTVLQNPRFGPRLLLSGVVAGCAREDFHGIVGEPEKETAAGAGAGTGAGISAGNGSETPTMTGKGTGPEGSLRCTMCERCVKVCPGGAIGPEGVDAFRCRTISAVIPPLLVPAVKWMLSRRMLLKVMAPLAPLVARTATIRCSLCVTECPNFAGAERKDAG
jgi:ferredoxin